MEGAQLEHLGVCVRTPACGCGCVWVCVCMFVRVCVQDSFICVASSVHLRDKIEFFGDVRDMTHVLE